MEISIRLANDSDMQILHEIYNRVSKQTFFWYEESEFDSLDIIQDTIGETVYIASVDDVIAGFISIYELESFVHHLYVLAEFQSQGVGTALIAYAVKKSAVPLQLKCAVKNTRALLFYLKSGWNVVGNGENRLGYFLVMELPDNSHRIKESND